MTRRDAVVYMQEKKNVGFIVRPISLHGYGILEVTDADKANLIICDLTHEEARHLTDVAKGFCV